MVSFRTLLYAITLASAALGQGPQPVVLALHDSSYDSCDSLTSLSLPNASILQVSNLPANSEFPVPGSCLDVAFNKVDLCRVYGVIFTSSSSSVKFEVWLPKADNWYGRILSTGNGGLNGCIDYANLDYGTSLHFATVGSDSGHDGFSALPLYRRPEVINDFSYRSVHATAFIGKMIVEAYYGKAPSRSYYLGCSAGGRQGMQSALRYPDDFDGIVAGAPAVDWNHFAGAGGITTRYVGADPEARDRFIPPDLWRVVTREVLRQCDGHDGIPDGIIAEPDDCDFNPYTLLCNDGETKPCLSQAQVQGLHDLYKPIYNTTGDMIWPRFDPGSEIDTLFQVPMAGIFSPITSEWMKYAIYNNPLHSFDNFDVSDVEYANTIDPGGISTWNGNFSGFRNKGGKLLTYHGSSDASIPSGNSKRFYNLISSTLSIPNLDDFYRLFLVPGMFHCQSSGAWAFGQGALVGGLSNVVNDTAHNILLALVEWVEGGVAPDTITGLDDRFAERLHCRYPYKSMWSTNGWTCV